MAASKRLIEVRITGSVGGSLKNGKKDTEPETDEEKEEKEGDSVNTVFILNIVKQAEELVLDGITYGLSNWFMLTDNYIAERNVNIAKGIIQKATGIGFGIGLAAAAGVPVIGAVMAGFAVLRTIGDIAKNYYEEGIRIKQMDEQLSYQRQRVGFALTSGSRGENK